MLTRKEFDDLKATGDLPSPRGAAIRVMELCDRGDATLPEIIAMLNTDPASVGRVLKLANSAVYGRPRPVAALSPDVLMSIGIRALRQIVLAFSLVSQYRHGRCREFDYVAFWSRSLARAVACQLIGAEARLAPAAEMFTCGLLARIGTLALASIYPEKYGAVLKNPEAETQLQRLERETFGLTHAELSAAMLGDWGLPKLFTDVVAVAETPAQAAFAPDTRMGRILACLVLADGLAKVSLGTRAERDDALPDVMPWAERLDLDAERVATLADAMREEWREWSRLLEIAVREPHEITADDLLHPVLSAGVQPPDSERISILVVDDDATTRALLRKLLVAAGHEVQVAADGREGFRLAHESKPDLIIVDWHMPEMDGLSLIRMLRGTSIGENVYIVMLTAHDEHERLIDAFEAGADDFIGKPIEPRVLQARLTAGLRAVATRHQLEAERDLLRANIKELANSERKAWDAALTDPLTGLFNRRHAIDRLNAAWAAAIRTGRPMSVMVADLDRFKSINDTYGHQAGDTVLREFANFLRSHSRLPDVPCRIGGEEFMVLLPDTSLEGALLHAERIRQTCETTRFPIDGSGIMVTTSIGVAERTAAMANHEALLRAADRALYAAKQQGRNRVVAATDLTPESEPRHGK